MKHVSSEITPPPDKDQLSRVDYYPQDEINLIDLWKMLASKKKIIFITIIFSTIFAVAYILTQPKIYKAEVLFVPPTEADIQPFNAMDQTLFTTEELYSRFLSAASSNIILKKVYDEQNLGLLLGDNGNNSETVFLNFAKKLLLQLPENSADNTYIQPSSLSLEGQTPKLISDFLNAVVKEANDQVIKETSAIIQQRINSRLNQLPNEISHLKELSTQQRQDEIFRIEEQDAIKRQQILDKISVARAKAEEKRLAKIMRLEEVDRIERAQILEKIDTLVASAETRRQDKIEQLKEAAGIASKLKLENMVSFPVIPAMQNQESDLAEIDRQYLPTYLMGGKALRAEISELESRKSDIPFISELRGLQDRLKELENNEQIEALKARKSNDPFIPELVDLQSQLRLLENNRVVENLKSRTNHDPFIPELRKLEQEALKLKTFSIDTSGTRAVIIDQAAYPPNSPIKPQSAAILTIGIIVGVFLGLLAAFFAHFIEKIRNNNEDDAGEEKQYIPSTSREESERQISPPRVVSN